MAPITETPQRRRTVFITVRKDKLSVPAEQMVDGLTLRAHRRQDFEVNVDQVKHLTRKVISTLSRIKIMWLSTLRQRYFCLNLDLILIGKLKFCKLIYRYFLKTAYRPIVSFAYRLVSVS